MRELLERMKKQGIVKAVSVITTPNPAGIALHEKFGFELEGTLKNAGFKNGEMHSFVYFSRFLNDSAGELKPDR